ncbi:macro domain-like protein [Dacryopinax primogenitus]|uniref:Macro domain-like protein n=1 Tax=Dacryopinax primogenitus (strain DJM 731) TaxID=1858805 RepID=M5FTZ3_DACPD|nr:macro domain-like protein [Dacryopinax primogenitus]EJU01146.1 macro domain-like protein [Dacryopinax primogenitus]
MATGIHFTLLDRQGELHEAWKTALDKYLPGAIGSCVTLLQKDIRDAGTYDCVVSPANSYGIMDGGIDLYIARAISPGDMMPVIRVVQAHLYTHYRGYISPGQCTLVPLLEGLCGEENVLKCKYVAVLPTMRVPERIDWQREIVYECMWNLLLSLDAHNSAPGEGKIETVVMSGLGTGVGGISPHKCAEQMVLAIKHYREATGEADKWRRMTWVSVNGVHEELEPTREM